LTLHQNLERADRRRSNWLLLAMAIPLGLVVGRLIPSWDNLFNAILVLTGGMTEPTYLQRFIAGTSIHIIGPTLIAFGVLKISQLGSWLAPNRIVIACFVAICFIVAFAMAYGLSQVFTGQSPYMGSALTKVIDALSVGFLSVGVVALCASTIWYRFVVNKRHNLQAKVIRHMGSWLREA
jgi:hypothetical protein